jgi:hypothetical protein
MAPKPHLEHSTTEAEAEARLGEALSLVKAATQRRAALTAVVSGLHVTPAEKRFAQSESKKVDREMRDAKRMLEDAQAFARTTKVRKAG